MFWAICIKKDKIGNKKNKISTLFNLVTKTMFLSFGTNQIFRASVFTSKKEQTDFFSNLFVYRCDFST